MASKKSKIIGVVVVIGAAYVAYKLLTRPAGASHFINTNNATNLPPVQQSPTNVPLNNLNQTAITNKNGVHIRRDPGVMSFLGSGFFDNTDSVVQKSGTPVGKVIAVASDANDPTQNWYKLDKTSSAFLHNGVPLYVNKNDVTF